jgi:hypothetical protein
MSKKILEIPTRDFFFNSFFQLNGFRQFHAIIVEVSSGGKNNALNNALKFH